MGRRIMNELEISVREKAGRPVIYLSGKITSRSVDQLQRTCLKSLRQLSSGELAGSPHSPDIIADDITQLR